MLLTCVKSLPDRTEALGKDEVDEQSYQIIQRKYDELLPEAHEIL